MILENKWLQDKFHTDSLVELFVENVTPEYISYGEVLCGRAKAADEWSPDLKKVLTEEIINILSSKTDSRIACSFLDNNIVGFAIVNINKNASTPYAFLEDIIVDSNYRNKGIGKELSNFIEEELTIEGIKQVYLESGINNNSAHRFFENRGYTLMAKVMCKTL